MSEFKLIRGGTVISQDPEIGTGPMDVLIKGEIIEKVARHIEVAEGAEIIDAAGAIVMPGFVDAHRHLWQTNIRAVAADWTVSEYVTYIRMGYAMCYEPDDAYISMLCGVLEALDAGVTTIGDFTHIMLSPEHSDAAVQALRDSGGRSILYYGCYDIPRQNPVFATHEARHADARRVRKQYFSGNSGLVTMGLATTETSVAGIDLSRKEIGLARELGLPMQLHMGTLSGRRGVQELHDAGLLGPDMLHVHCTFTSDEELALIARSGGKVCSTVETEMQMAMGFPMLHRALRVGLRPSVGVDIVSDCSGDMFAQIRLGLQTARALLNQNLLDRGYAPPTLDLTAKTGLAFGTTYAAEGLGLDGAIGSLTPGKAADVIILRSNGVSFDPMPSPEAIVVLHAHPGNVETVLVNGQYRKRNSKLVGYDLPALRARLNQSYQRMEEARRTVSPRESDISRRYADIVIESTTRTGP